MKQSTNTRTFWSRMTMVVVLLTVGFGAAFAQGFWPDYDFKAANSDGDTLYYRITSATAPYTVAVTRCHDSATYASQLPLYDYDTLVVVPDTVSFGEMTYSVTAVDERAFSLQQGICTIQLPSNIVSIDAGAFAHSSLQNITIPSTVTFLGDSVFAYTLVKTIEIPGSVLILKTGTFVGCDSLKYFTMHEGLREIEENIFSSNRIQTLTFPASLREFRPLTDGTLSCKQIVFQTDSVHPNDTLHLAPSCFRGMSQHLQHVDFSDNIFQLPGSCFANFQSLAGTVTLPNRLTVVPYRCFYNCQFYDILFPENLDTIAEQAFMNSDVNHPLFTIPASTKHIGSRAFYKGGNSIFILECEQPPTLGEQSFNTNRYNEFTVPCGSLSLYLTAPGWSSIVTSQYVIIGEEEGCVGVEEHDLAKFKAYPNPAEDVVFVELNGNIDITNIALYDLQGRIVETVPTARLHGSETATLNVRNIPTGVYVLRVTDVEGNKYHQKLVVK